MSARSELIRALGVLCEPPHPGNARIADALDLPGGPAPGDYAEVFLFQAYPYASVYLGEEGMIGAEARDRVAGFWRALRIVPPPEPDHLAALLGLYAGLIEEEDLELAPARAALRRESRRALLWEHLLSWALPYLAKVEEIAPPYYRAWAGLLSRTLVGEAALVGPQDRLPLGLREARPLPGVREDPGRWIGALLAPVRSGVIVTRADLLRCARRLGVGSRIGERAYVLRGLLEQDPEGTLAWLAAEALDAAGRHAAQERLLGPVATFWRGRAEASAFALRATLAAA